MCRDLLEKTDPEQNDILDYISFTDNYRYDDKKYINLSIQHPNVELLKSFIKKQSNDISIHWCILKIDKKYIYKKGTLFSVTNAANKYNQTKIGISEDFDKFKQMFSDNLYYSTSYGSKIISRNKLKDKYPTDSQAEVLVQGEIPVEDILQVCFINTEELSSCKAAFKCEGLSTDKFVVDKSLFLETRL